MREMMLAETRRISEKEALIEEKLEASLQSQERERKLADSLVCRSFHRHLTSGNAINIL